MKKPWLEGIEIVDVNTSEPAWGGWVETLLLTFIVVTASFLTSGDDPFRLREGFPWPVLAPLLAGLRYGFAYSFTSALLTLAVLGVAINQEWQTASAFPLSWSIGILLIAMVAGEFRDMWGRRLHRLEGAYQYRAERLEEFTRSYQLLRLSHDRLEQTVASSGLSLREGIMHLQSRVDSIEGLTDASLQKLIEFLSEYCSLTQARIVGIRGDKLDPGQVQAFIGDRFPVDETDPVIGGALDSGELAAVNLLKEHAVERNALLAAVPLADSTGEVHAMLLIRSMPFFAFHESNLKLLAVLVAHGVDHLRFGSARPSAARFIISFERACLDSRRFGLDATLLRLTGEPAEVLECHDALRSSIRAIDLICLAREAGGSVIWVLLPLTGIAAARAWMQRTDAVSATLASELISIDELDPGRIRSMEPH